MLEESTLRLIGGGLVIVLATLLGGLSGFGQNLVSTPLLLLLGFPLPFVVTINLAIVALTRLPVAIRLRDSLTPGRVSLLVVALLPGSLAGLWVLTVVDHGLIKRGIGLAVLAAVVAMLWRRRWPASPARPARLPVRPARPARLPVRPARPAAPLLAGLLGGFLGATASISGVPPALLLTQNRVGPRQFHADLAVYFVVGNLLTLAILGLGGSLAPAALWPVAPLWLPGGLLGDLVGARLGLRLPRHLFAALTLVIIGLAGLVTLLAA